MQVTKWKKSPDVYPLHDIRVVDGDTIQARIALPFGQSVVKRIRLKGWWADETEGFFAANGILAKQRLNDYLAFRVVWLLSPSCRMDKYGRVIGHIMVQEKIVDPREVLGDLQLSEKVHKEHRDIAKAYAATGAPRPPSAPAMLSVLADDECERCGEVHRGLESCGPLPSPDATNPDAPRPPLPPA